MVTTRDRILTAARKLLEERGFDVGMGEIFRRAGISRQAVYLHFTSKTDLLQQLTPGSKSRQTWDRCSSRCSTRPTGKRR